jgi:hypothetical protein
MTFFPQDNIDNNVPSQSILHLALFSLIYFLYLLIQAADANRLFKNLINISINAKAFMAQV